MNKRLRSAHRVATRLRITLLRRWHPCLMRIAQNRKWKWLAPICFAIGFHWRVWVTRRSYLKNKASTDGQEVGFASLTLIASFFFLAPIPQISSSPLIQALCGVLPHVVIGAILLISGLASVVGYYEKDYNWRIAGMLGIEAFWGFAAVVMFIHAPFWFGPYLNFWFTREAHLIGNRLAKDSVAEKHGASLRADGPAATTPARR